MRELTIKEAPAPPREPGEADSLAVSLARAEVDLQVKTARAFPRSITRAVEHILALATLDGKTAEGCIYALPRGRDDEGKKKIVRGPSIRLAEITASQWGNCRIGARLVHVDRFEKYIEAEGVFHDLETNTAWTARVRRGIADKRGRIYSEDMIVVTGNAACAIAKRNAIFSGVPRGVWGKGYDAAGHVIAGDMKTLASRRRSALATMTGEYNIAADRIFEALEISGEEDIDLERLSILTAMRTSLKNGEATIDELFPKLEAKGEAAPKGLDAKLDAIAAVAGQLGNIGDFVTKDPPHDPETGEITGGEIAELPEPTDPGTQRLLADGRAKTKEGARILKYWIARLSQSQFDQLAPYIDELRAEAEAVDAMK